LSKKKKDLKVMKKRLWTFLFCLLGFCAWGDMTQPVIIVETSKGNIEIQLKPDVAPKACENMIKLAEKGYYDGCIFHRIIPGFMIQGGDPDGTGCGGVSIWGKSFADECTDKVKFDKKGLLAMANSGPNTNGSQFFITVAPTGWLNGNHTIFGEVISGYDVVEKLEAEGSQSGAPNSIQMIKKMYLKKDAEAKLHSKS